MGPKFGPRLKEIQARIAADPERVAEGLAGPGPFSLDLPSGEPVQLTPEDVTIGFIAPEGWGGAALRGTEVALDATITPELAAEGMAREAVRHVQELRKSARLADGRSHRAVLTRGVRSSWQGPGGAPGIHCRRDSRSQVVEPATGDGAHNATVKVDEQTMQIQLRIAG